jgi:hypothetical protein
MYELYLLNVQQLSQLSCYPHGQLVHNLLGVMLGFDSSCLQSKLLKILTRGLMIFQKKID